MTLAAQTAESNEFFTEILQHRIRCWVRGDGAPGELDDASVEHLTKMISEGYNQGELCLAVYGPGDADFEEYRGWWEIVTA